MAKLMENLEYPLHVSNDSVFDSAIYSWRLESYVYIRIFKLQILSLLCFYFNYPSINVYEYVRVYLHIVILCYFLISWEVAGAMQQLRIHRLNDVYDVMMSFNF